MSILLHTLSPALSHVWQQVQLYAIFQATQQRANIVSTKPPEPAYLEEYNRLQHISLSSRLNNLALKFGTTVLYTAMHLNEM